MHTNQLLLLWSEQLTLTGNLLTSPCTMCIGSTKSVRAPQHRHAETEMCLQFAARWSARTRAEEDAALFDNGQSEQGSFRDWTDYVPPLKLFEDEPVRLQQECQQPRV